jgi:hypothetical protein
MGGFACTGACNKRSKECPRLHTSYSKCAGACVCVLWCERYLHVERGIIWPTAAKFEHKNVPDDLLQTVRAFESVRAFLSLLGGALQVLFQLRRRGSGAPHRHEGCEGG